MLKSHDEWRLQIRDLEVAFATIGGAIGDYRSERRLSRVIEFGAPRLEP
ncbi:MAG: hypothetical protein AAF497_11750 [Planctomycetota bacterium]